MASEIPRERVYGNFKPAKSERITAAGRRSAEKRASRPGNDLDHLAALRRCPCVVTLLMPAGEVHHLKQGTGERGMGQRSSDRWGLPMSRLLHAELERQGSRNETVWFRNRGIAAPVDLAAALWAASPDVTRMIEIIVAHRRQGRSAPERPLHQPPPQPTTEP